MSEPAMLTLKNESSVKKKIGLSLALNLIIAILGVTSLYEKFFLIDGVIAFRAFTVDGNLFTTIVAIIATIANIRELIAGRESDSKVLFFLELCSVVSEAVIFIVVMAGYLPFVTDTPKITPYHMFCLHVAIPVLSVARFIFLQKPAGILKPAKLLRGAIPIGIYGIGVVIAIKAGVLPTSFVPYSFLDFEHNYIWYFLFALFAIPGVGYLWSWIFYRLNLNASSRWYRQSDLDQLRAERIKSLSRFDVVNSSILIVFCLLAVFLLSFSLMTTSTTSTTVQNELMSYMSFLLLDDYDVSLGFGEWRVENGALYKGDLFVSDGTSDTAFETDELMPYNTTIYLPSSKLVPELAAQYDPKDYVAVKFFQGEGGGPHPVRGEVLDPKIVREVIDSGLEEWYAQVKIERELTAEEEKYREQLRQIKETYYRFVMSFGATMSEDDVGIIELYIPYAMLTDLVKYAERSSDYFMAAVIVSVFSVLFISAYLWIRSLEKSIDFLKILAQGETPEKPLYLGKSRRISGLAGELNDIRNKRMKNDRS